MFEFFLRVGNLKPELYFSDFSSQLVLLNCPLAEKRHEERRQLREQRLSEAEARREAKGRYFNDDVRNKISRDVFNSCPLVHATS